MDSIKKQTGLDGRQFSRRDFLKSAGAAIVSGAALGTSTSVDAGDVYDPIKGYNAAQRPQNITEVVDKLVELNLIESSEREHLKTRLENMVKNTLIPEGATFKATDVPEIFFDDLIHAIKNGFITKPESSNFLRQENLAISANKFGEIKRYHRANGRDPKKTRAFIVSDVIPELKRKAASSLGSIASS